MNTKEICYKPMRNYKYQLVGEVHRDTDLRPAIPVKTEHIEMDMDGHLTIKSGYCWDGPSGPSVDTKSFMRASLIHDALYQLIREGYLDMSDREYADRLMQFICKEDGMSAFRRWYVYRAVRFGGYWAAQAKKHGEEQYQTICI